MTRKNLPAAATSLFFPRTLDDLFQNQTRRVEIRSES